MSGYSSTPKIFLSATSRSGPEKVAAYSTSSTTTMIKPTSTTSSAIFVSPPQLNSPVPRFHQSNVFWLLLAFGKKCEISRTLDARFGQRTTTTQQVCVSSCLWRPVAARNGRWLEKNECFSAFDVPKCPRHHMLQAIRTALICSWRIVLILAQPTSSCMHARLISRSTHLQTVDSQRRSSRPRRYVLLLSLSWPLRHSDLRRRGARR